MTQAAFAHDAPTLPAFARGPVEGWAARRQGGTLEPLSYVLPELGPHDVEVEVSHCGICGSDVHLVDDDWGGTRYPLVPGHEIVGYVRRIGAAVDHLRLGDRVGVGWQCGSCGTCAECEDGHENVCTRASLTCVGHHGGFAEAVVADARFAYRIPDALRSPHAAPLLCAGATVFAPLRRFHVGPGQRVGVIGLGGLGHLAVQFARALGADVSVFTSSPEKRRLARRFGADEVLPSSDKAALKGARGRFDLLLSTSSGNLPWSRYLQTLRPRGTLCFVGMPSEPAGLPVGLLVSGERSVCGSAVASPRVMREMLALAADRQVLPTIERLPMREANVGIDRVRRGEARFRVVLEH